MRRNKNTSKLVIAVVVAFLTTMIAYSALSGMHRQLTEQQKLISQMQSSGGNASGQEQTYTYAVATKNLKAGEIVSDEDVDFKQFDAKEDNAFEDRSDVINKVLLRDIQSGSTFTTSHIAKVSSDDVTLRPGYRALTLPAENFQGKSNKMLAGSNVDIYSASGDSPWKLEDVRIVAMESDSSTKDATSNAPDITKASAITFEVSASQIADFITNASKGKLVLVARNPNDRTVHRSTGAYHSSEMSYAPISSGRRVSKRRHSSYSGGGVPSSLPSLPSSVPIKNLGGGYAGLPQPIKPHVMQQSSSVEMIQANVKSKVTFN